MLKEKLLPIIDHEDIGEVVKLVNMILGERYTYTYTKGIFGRFTDQSGNRFRIEREFYDKLSNKVEAFYAQIADQVKNQ